MLGHDIKFRTLAEASIPGENAKGGFNDLATMHRGLLESIAKSPTVKRQILSCSEAEYIRYHNSFIQNFLDMRVGGVFLKPFRIEANYVMPARDGYEHKRMEQFAMRSGRPISRPLQHVRPRLIKQLDGGKKKVLFLGPNSFRKEVWEIRYKYLFPDLFNPISQEYDISILVANPPEHTVEGFEFLKNKFPSLNIITFDSHKRIIDMKMAWFLAAEKLCRILKPDVVTNIQGGTLFGHTLATLKSVTDMFCVLRVAGDEIKARVDLGYYKNLASFQKEFLLDVYCQNKVDRIIAMSDWELSRIKALVHEENKVILCHRGVDTEKFCPTDLIESAGLDKSQQQIIPRVLYLGRKSAEKGYDKVQELAKISKAKKYNVEYMFAGPGFEVKKVRNENRIGFISPDDLPGTYNKIDALILVSTTESLGLVVLEALSCGRLCLVDDEKYEKMFADCPAVIRLSGPPKARAQQISELLNDRDELTRLQALARSYAESELDSRKWSLRYKEIISGMI